MAEVKSSPPPKELKDVDELKLMVNEFTKNSPGSLLREFIKRPRYKADAGIDANEAALFIKGVYGNIDPISILGRRNGLEFYGWMQVFIGSGKTRIDDQRIKIPGESLRQIQRQLVEDLGSKLPQKFGGLKLSSSESTAGTCDTVGGDEKGLRFALIGVNVQFTSSKIGHQIGLLIDRKEIEEYDSLVPISESRTLSRELETWCKKRFPDHGFLPFKDICPGGGVQKVDKDYCSLMMYLWVYARISSPETYQGELAQFIKDVDAKGMIDDLLLRMTSWITEELDIINQPANWIRLQEHDGTYNRLHKATIEFKDARYLKVLGDYNRQVQKAYTDVKFEQFLALIMKGFPDFAKNSKFGDDAYIKYIEAIVY
jgi:hypothetical protein